jgi:hypothetical protein
MELMDEHVRAYWRHEMKQLANWIRENEAEILERLIANWGKTWGGDK